MAADAVAADRTSWAALGVRLFRDGRPPSPTGAGPVAEKGVRIDPAIAEKLRAMGYLR